MLAFLVRGALRMLALAGALYFTFFVSLGDRTLYGHMSRIAATSEARELTTAVSDVAGKVKHLVADRLSVGNP